MLSKSFMLAGKATFTVEVAEGFKNQFRTQPHYTFRITRKEYNGEPMYFAALLAGADNENDYVYMGTVNPFNGALRLTGKSKLGAGAWPVKILGRVLAAVWSEKQDAIGAAGWGLHHDGKCGRCARTLTVPESIKCGIGPECRRLAA